MPIYEYECPQCHHVIALTVCIGHNKTHYCGKCAPERKKMKRILSTFMGYVKNPAVPRRAK